MQHAHDFMPRSCQVGETRTIVCSEPPRLALRLALGTAARITASKPKLKPAPGIASIFRTFPHGSCKREKFGTWQRGTHKINPMPRLSHDLHGNVPEES